MNFNSHQVSRAVCNPLQVNKLRNFRRVILNQEPDIVLGPWKSRRECESSLLKCRGHILLDPAR
jgi:hypothetical protein